MIVLRPLFAVIMLCGLLLAVPAQYGHSQTAPSASGMPQDAEIYLLRGLFGIYSLGMDSLAEKLKAQGYSPTVTMWDSAQTVADRIIANHRRGDTAHLVLIGHSLGSNAVIQIADKLKAENIPVDLLVTFDVTENLVVPNNVARFINFYQQNGFGRAVTAEAGFQGEFSNLNLSADTNLSHTNIDEAPQLQAFVMNRIYELTHTHVRTVAAKRKSKRS